MAVYAFAPRSYWKSTNRTPTQKGLLNDYETVISRVQEEHPTARVTIYAHSLGGAIAACLLAERRVQVDGIILENPFSSISDMVRALYPSKWLPYYYLGPLAWDKWDAGRAVEGMAEQYRKRMLILNSEDDELVPIWMGERLAGSISRRVIIPKMLHETAWRSSTWRKVVGEYLKEIQSLPMNRI